MEELLSLKWNNHSSTFVKVLGSIRGKQKYTDVTLACSGKFYNAHKMVLSTCSDYFEEIFDQADEKNLVIVLKDISSDDLELLLDYMYLGEVSVKQTDLSSLLKAAECLQIKGLAVADDVEDTCKQVNPQKTISPVPSKKRKVQDISDNNSNNLSSIPRRQSKRKSYHATESIEELNPPTEDNDSIVIKEEAVAYEPETISVDDYKEEEVVETIPSIPPKLDVDPDRPNTESLSSLKSCIEEQNTFPTSSYEADPTEWLNDDSSLSYPANDYSQPETSGQASVANVKRKRQCPYCTKKVINLLTHVRIHTGEKPYRCHHCMYQAARKDGLLFHLAGKHNIYDAKI